MSNWDTVIGLEVHVQLATKTKIFSGASTAFGAEAQHPSLRHRPGHARHLARAQQTGRTLRRDVWPGD